MPDVVPALGRREEGQRGRGECCDLVERARARRPQKCFQFRERHLNRIEVWAVRREESDVGAGGFNRGADLRLFVDGEIVEDDDVAWLERRREHLLDVRAKAGVIDRPIEHGRRGQAGGAECGDDRVRLPMAAGRVVVQPDATATASVAAQQIGRDPAFIEKDVVPRVVQR